MKKICVIGLGYRGLPTVALLANRGYGVHKVKNTVDVINQSKIHIVKPEFSTKARDLFNICYNKHTKQG